MQCATYSTVHFYMFKNMLWIDLKVNLCQVSRRYFWGYFVVIFFTLVKKALTLLVLECNRITSEHVTCGSVAGSQLSTSSSHRRDLHKFIFLQAIKNELVMIVEPSLKSKNGPQLTVLAKQWTGTCVSLRTQ